MRHTAIVKINTGKSSGRMMVERYPTTAVTFGRYGVTVL
jgi:hypothetical protein